MNEFAQVYLEDDTAGAVYGMEVIVHEGARWLVARWNESLDGSVRVPARIVRLDGLPHDRLPSGSQDAYLLRVALPRALVLDPAQWPAGGRFVVVDLARSDPAPPASLH